MAKFTYSVKGDIITCAGAYANTSGDVESDFEMRLRIEGDRLIPLNKYTVFILTKDNSVMTDGNGNEIIDDNNNNNNNQNNNNSDPDESTSKAFKGLKEIYAETWGGVAFGNPQCDDDGRLTYYKAMFNRNMKYEYSGNSIISKCGTEYGYEQNTYTLSNGLITSFVRQSYYDDELRYTDYYTIKYDSNKRIIQIISDDREGNYYSKTYYNFKWNSSGDLYESNYVNYDETKDPSYTYTYEYLSSSAQTPCMILGGNELWCAFNLNIDPILVMEGYYGNSMPKRNLKSKYAVMVFRQKPYERYNWSYSFDTKGRVTKVTQELEDLYENGKRDETNVFTFKWE